MPDDRIDDMLAELRGTAADDQIMAALDTLARRVGHYYVALLCNAVGPDAAAALALDFQRGQLYGGNR